MNKLSAADRKRKEEVFGNLEKAMSEAMDFVQEQAATMRDFYDEKSDSWKDSAGGQKYLDWVETWELLANDMEDSGIISELGNLPDAPT